MKPLWITLGLSLIIVFFFLFDTKDPREIILGTWHEPNNNFMAEIDREKIFVTLTPKRKYTFLYALNTDTNPIEISVWRENQPESVYSGELEINNSEEIFIKPNLKKNFPYYNGPTRFKWNKLLPNDS